MCKPGEIFKGANDEIKIVLEEINLVGSSVQGDAVGAALISVWGDVSRSSRNRAAGGAHFKIKNQLNR